MGDWVSGTLALLSNFTPICVSFLFIRADEQARSSIRSSCGAVGSALAF